MKQQICDLRASQVTEGRVGGVISLHMRLLLRMLTLTNNPKDPDGVQGRGGQTAGLRARARVTFHGVAVSHKHRWMECGAQRPKYLPEKQWELKAWLHTVNALGLFLKLVLPGKTRTQTHTVVANATVMRAGGHSSGGRRALQPKLS